MLETTVPTSWRNPSVQTIRRTLVITVLEYSCVSHVLISKIPTYIPHISYLIFSYHTSQGKGGVCYATNKLLQSRASIHYVILYCTYLVYCAYSTYLWDSSHRFVCTEVQANTPKYMQIEVLHISLCKYMQMHATIYKYIQYTHTYKYTQTHTNTQ